MENLNAEQVKKALEKVEDTYIYLYHGADGLWHEVRYSHILALITSQEQRIKELTEENERLRAEVSVKRKLLDKAEVRIECVEEENNQLKADICNVTMNLEHITKENDRLKADTVRKMQERLHKEATVKMLGTEMLLPIAHSLVDRIAKEMLEGCNE